MELEVSLFVWILLIVVSLRLFISLENLSLGHSFPLFFSSLLYLMYLRFPFFPIFIRLPYTPTLSTNPVALSVLLRPSKGDAFTHTILRELEVWNHFFNSPHLITYSLCIACFFASASASLLLLLLLLHLLLLLLLLCFCFCYCFIFSSCFCFCFCCCCCICHQHPFSIELHSLSHFFIKIQSYRKCVHLFLIWIFLSQFFFFHLHFQSVLHSLSNFSSFPSFYFRYFFSMYLI